MAIKIKLYQHKRKDLQGKWYGRTVKAGEVTTKDLARIISHNNSVTESDVHGVIIALVKEMKNYLREGHTVVLDDFGRFHLTVQSEMVEKKEDFDLRKHIRSDMPRTFVWQTATDDLLRAYETSEFVTTLMKAGVPCEFHLFQCGQHGMALADKTTSATPGDVNPAASNWVALAQTWLDRDGSPINHAL